METTKKTPGRETDAGKLIRSDAESSPLHMSRRPGETKTRSFLKIATWRLTGTLTTTGVTYLMTGKANTAMSVGLVDILAKPVLQYVFERVWTHIPGGYILDKKKSGNITATP